MKRSIASDIQYVNSIAPGGNFNSTQTGTTVDTLQFDEATVIVAAGTVTDGSYLPSVLESDDSASGFTAVAAGDLDGTFVALTTGLVQSVGYLGDKRYLQVVLTKTGGGSTGIKAGAGVLLSSPAYAPVA